MFRLAMTIISLLLGVVAASAQTQSSDEHPYGLDPYKPSDAALLRDYGDTLVAQTPLAELRKLDPYKPSHAALLRDLGGAIPLWGIVWYPGPVPASLTPFPIDRTQDQPKGRMLRDPLHQRRDFDEENTVAPAAAAPSSIATLQRPETNDGVWIEFANQKWISAGHTVPFAPSTFERIGEYDGFSVFRSQDASEDMIYVPTREGRVAPYRRKP